MTRALRFAALALVAGAALAHEPVLRLPLPAEACRDGSPLSVWVVNAADATDCSAGGGVVENECCCVNGSWVDCVGSAAAGGYATCQEEGSSLTQRTTINFVGASVTCADAGGKTVCTFTDATGPSVILDLGDDGGNDSTGLTEIAPVNDDYGVCTESSADKLKIDVGKIAPYRQYDPNRPPSTCASCEEWTGDTATLSWSWGNQGGTTETLEMDGATIAAPQNTATALRVRCVAAPAATDFTVHALVAGIPLDAYNHFGIALLQGTLATPTRIDSITPTSLSVSVTDIRSQRYTNYTTYGAAHADTYDADGSEFRTRPVFLRIAFTDSGDTATFSYSYEGRIYTNVGSGIAIAANPAFVCLVLNSEDNVYGVTAHYQWFRIRTDSGRAWPSD